MKNVSKDTVYQSLTEKSSSNRKVYLTMDEYFEKNKANVNVVKTERKLKKATSSRRKK